MINTFTCYTLTGILALIVVAIGIFLWRESRRVSINEEIVLASAEKQY